jgi:hypothetical protein
MKGMRKLMKITGLYFFSKCFIFIAGVFLGYILFAEIGLFVSFSGEDNYHLVKDGVVADAKTAVKIAKAVWKPIYGGLNGKMYLEWSKQHIKGILFLHGIFLLVTMAVKDHRHSRWLEEAPLKGAKNLDVLALPSLISLGSVCTPGFVFHPIRLC